MISIRNYSESDVESVGKLIADTYSEFNLSFVSAEELGLFLGPFRYARSQEKVHQEAISQVIKSAMVFVAENDREIRSTEGQKDTVGKSFCQSRSSQAGNWAEIG